MSEIKKLIDRLLTREGCEDRYLKRKELYSELEARACLPSELAKISNDEPPWYCHGLAFRMATFSNGSEEIFTLLNKLIASAEGCCGWNLELKKWTGENDHWAKKWDKYFHFLWLLQCVEYFKDCGYKVTFPGNNGNAAPDLKIHRDKGDPVFVECTVYSKWWLNECFLEDILFAIDNRLSIHRTSNIARDASSNPFFERNLPETLKKIARVMTPEFLEKARMKADKVSPQILYECNDHDFKVLIEGDGEYQPDPDNAHGNARCSMPVYLNEIIKSKEGQNDLSKSRPNILMVNGLGLDFHFGISCGEQIVDKLESDEIDEVWISECGINDLMRADKLKKRIIRQSYAGACL